MNDLAQIIRGKHTTYAYLKKLIGRFLSIERQGPSLLLLLLLLLLGYNYPTWFTVPLLRLPNVPASPSTSFPLPATS